MAVATPLASSDVLRRVRDMRGHAKRLGQIIGFEKVAVAREYKPLRRRLVCNVPWRTGCCVWRPWTTKLPRCERVAIDNDRWLAAETLVVDERGWRENICRARR